MIDNLNMTYNGNLTKDLNKKITGIQLNCLDLPEKVQFESGNSYSSYGEVVDGEINIVGISFNADLKPITLSGIGYRGAFVYEPIDNFFLKVSHFLEGTKYLDGILTWNVNLQVRITGIVPKIGFPLLSGKKLKSGKVKMGHPKGKMPGDHIRQNKQVEDLSQKHNLKKKELYMK